MLHVTKLRDEEGDFLYKLHGKLFRFKDFFPRFNLKKKSMNLFFLKILFSL